MYCVERSAFVGMKFRCRRLVTDVDQLDLRDHAGWQLTEAGHSFLDAIEKAASATPEQITPPEIIVPQPAPRVAPPLRLVADNPRQRRRASEGDLSSNRSAVA
jgi:hypothetical protein